MGIINMLHFIMDMFGKTSCKLGLVAASWSFCIELKTIIIFVEAFDKVALKMIKK